MKKWAQFFVVQFAVLALFLGVSLAAASFAPVVW